MNQSVYVRGSVVKGFGRGSKELGCPTANIDNIQQLTIPTGIYCGLVQLVIRDNSEVQEEQDNKLAYESILHKLPYISQVRGMVCSFGYNPQYGNKDKSLEVHILENFDFNFYGAELRVLICKKMRDEEKYNSLEELKQAIALDIKNAKNEISKFEDHAKNRDYFIEGSVHNNGIA